MIYTFVPELMLEKPEILQTYNFTPDCEPFIIISDFFSDKRCHMCATDY